MLTGEISIMFKRLIFLSLLFVLLLSACSNKDELSGKTFDVSVVGSPNEPFNLDSIMRLEFSDGNVTTKAMNGAEGTYELKDDNLVIQFENENESLEIEFTFKESNIETSEYAAEIIDSDFQIEDSEQVSNYKDFYFDLPSHVEFIEK